MHFPVAHLRKVGSLPNPEDSLRLLVERAPRAEAWAERNMLKLRPSLTLLYGIRRRIATAAIALFTIWFFVHLMFGANGMVVYRQKKAEYQNLRSEITAVAQENEHLTRNIDSLANDPKAIEQEARQQLHYARPGEVIYFSPSPGTPNPRDNSS